MKFAARISVFNQAVPSLSLPPSVAVTSPGCLPSYLLCICSSIVDNAAQGIQAISPRSRLQKLLGIVGKAQFVGRGCQLQRLVSAPMCLWRPGKGGRQQTVRRSPRSSPLINTHACFPPRNWFAIHGRACRLLMGHLSFAISFVPTEQPIIETGARFLSIIGWSSMGDVSIVEDWAVRREK